MLIKRNPDTKHQSLQLYNPLFISNWFERHKSAIVLFRVLYIFSNVGVIILLARFAFYQVVYRVIHVLFIRSTAS